MRTSSQMSFAHCALASNAPTRVDFPIPDGAMRAMAWSSMASALAWSKRQPRRYRMKGRTSRSAM